MAGFEQETALRDAGVSFRALEVAHDPRRGMVAELELDDGAARETAGEVLGRFTLPFTIR
jgi:hypothetical protein